MMTKLISAVPVSNFQVALTFSDGVIGIWDAAPLFDRTGSLLQPLRDPAYFARCFIDAGALCWPNGLELSPDRLREQVRTSEHAT